MKFKKIASLLLAGIMFTSCGSGITTSTSGDINEPQHEKYPEFIQVDVFNSFANYQGIQTGWFAKIVKDKFNMELNIIAPNVAGGGDTLYQTRMASGDLGDLILAPASDGKLEELSKYGLLYDMSSHIDNTTYLKQYPIALEEINSYATTEGIWAMPMDVSSGIPTDSSDGIELTFAPYLRWDLYKELGYPEMATSSDMLPVLKQMQELSPTTESGKKVYGFSFFGDWDGDFMTFPKQFALMYGYDAEGYALLKADGSNIQSLIDKDSVYIKALKLLFDANQMGLVDPESTTQNYDMTRAKAQEGGILFSPWPWFSIEVFNTEERINKGIGYATAPVDDMELYSFGLRPSGSEKFYGVGSKAKDPERLVDFIDWLYSPEGNHCVTSGAAGPEGIIWEMGDNGPELTEIGKNFYFGDQNMVLPDELGGGTYKNGLAALYNTIVPVDIDPNTGHTYSETMWPSVIELKSTPLSEDWSAHMGAANSREYFEGNNQFIISAGSSYLLPQEPTEISTKKGQISEIIKEYSWKMIFANSEEEFNSLYDTLLTQANGLGYEEVYKYFENCAKDKIQAQKEIIEKYSN